MHENNNAFILVVMILLSIYVTFQYKPAYALYVWTTLFTILLCYHYGANLEGAQFESAFRYVLLLFPCFIALGQLMRRWWTLVPYILIGLQWQYFLLDMFTHWKRVA